MVPWSRSHGPMGPMVPWVPWSHFPTFQIWLQMEKCSFMKKSKIYCETHIKVNCLTPGSKLDIEKIS